MMHLELAREPPPVAPALLEAECSFQREPHLKRLGWMKNIGKCRLT
jgi:hypothetical protein